MGHASYRRFLRRGSRLGRQDRIERRPARPEHLANVGDAQTAALSAEKLSLQFIKAAIVAFGIALEGLKAGVEAHASIDYSIAHDYRGS